jgi:hypothetical protein
VELSALKQQLIGNFALALALSLKKKSYGQLGNQMGKHFESI